MIESVKGKNVRCLEQKGRSIYLEKLTVIIGGCEPLLELLVIGLYKEKWG